MQKKGSHKYLKFLMINIIIQLNHVKVESEPRSLNNNGNFNGKCLAYNGTGID